MRDEAMDEVGTQHDYLLVLAGAEAMDLLQKALADDRIRDRLVERSMQMFRDYRSGKDERIWPLFRAAMVLDAFKRTNPAIIDDPGIRRDVEDLMGFLKYQRLRFSGGFAAFGNGEASIAVRRRAEAITQFTSYLTGLLSEAS